MRTELNSFIFKCFEWKTNITPQAKHDQQLKYLRDSVEKYVQLILFHSVYCKNVFENNLMLDQVFEVYYENYLN